MTFNLLSEVQVTRRQIPSWKLIPNTGIQGYPLIIYHGAFDATSAELEDHLEAVGEVMPQWTYTMYSQTHFHSTTHEVLGVVAGRARLCFGGEENPQRFEPTVESGDLIIVPAGVGHRLLEDEGKQPFRMVGSYPHDRQWDMCYGRPGEEERVKRIQNLPWFHRDPLYGDSGLDLFA
ncbi:hypothetical protein N7532_011518 [Penicillium argentinense]|uniref:Cupin type-2 domain-containing protein n=1 Tax=Penicillium argentinense TaxID=1131581 RepID=A0A9W9EIQ6_9EURO|nr:uncharacterized protein N7532_011518 [Penicillium argentinense]KAJ5082475.1 hypothetical protein N7532_011518 [Penicillium argentinense]